MVTGILKRSRTSFAFFDSCSALMFRRMACAFASSERRAAFSGEAGALVDMLRQRRGSQAK